jgi:CspA family cold shock protein
MPTVAISAEVLWFNAVKGFGFVKLSDGREIFLPIRVLEAAGSRDISEGTNLKVILGETPRGTQVVEVVEIGEPSATGAIQAEMTTTGAQEIGGTVKWYNSEKGFGFIAPDSDEKDVFVHASVLTRAGIAMLAEGQKVFIECGPGKKGSEVRSIRLA